MITDEDRDRRLAEVIDALTDGRGDGRERELEAAVLRYPDLADEIRELWAAASIAEDLAGSYSRDETGAWPSPDLSTGPEDSPRTFGGYELLEEVGRGG